MRKLARDSNKPRWIATALLVTAQFELDSGRLSKGAVVAGYTTAATVPTGIPAEYAQYIPEPMAPEVADHVASVVLLGTPSDEFMRDRGPRGHSRFG